MDYGKVLMLAALAMLGSGLDRTAEAATDRLVGQTTRYDQEYPAIDYSGPARDNRVWRLQQKLDSGQVKLQWEPRWGYLRSLLRALEIDLSSQTLVFSKTSLQIAHISEQTPRAIYFNDDTYVGYVQGSDLIELAAVDAKVGAVFFGIRNNRDGAPLFEREGGRCLTCHDTYSMMGGGVPRVMVMTAPVDDPSDRRTFDSATEVDDRTAISERWGGWYLSGWYLSGGKGTAAHFGNLPLRAGSGVDQGARLRELRTTRDNRGNLAGYFDTTAYLTDKSDVVALLVLEHQTLVQNLITRVLYKVHNVVPAEPTAASRSWKQLEPRQQTALKTVIEPLVRALFFADAAPLTGQVVTSSGFTDRFALRGPRDGMDRGLRDLALDDRLFQHRLSYMIYTESFNALPAYARDYVDARIIEVLQGRDRTGISERLGAEERAAILQILAATLPRFGALITSAR